MRLPLRKSELLRRANEVHDDYFTPEAIARFKRNLKTLKEIDRPKAVSDMSDAAAMGDRSENAAYSEARGRLTRIDGRIMTLEARLRNAIVINGGSDKITLGSRVRVRVNGRERDFHMVGIQEANPTAGRISYRSPVGEALIGHVIGETINIQVGDRDVEYEIISIE